MKILFVVTAAEFGGASRHVLALSGHLLGKGCKVGIVAAPEPRLMREAKRLGAQVFPNRYFVRPTQLQNDIRALGPVWRALRKFQPDLVSAHSTKAGYAARLLCTLLGVKPVLFTAHGWAFTEGRSEGARRWLARAERLAARVTSKIICVSEHDRELALRFRVGKPEQLVTVHNGMDPSLFLAARGHRVRSELGLGRAPVITYAGRLAPPKDPLTLLRACRMLPGDFRVLLVGEGELRNSVREYAQRNGLGSKVVLLGEREDVPEILAASDVFVLPSDWEGLPRSIIEAMMAGLPVAATRVGGVPELVEDGVTGYLVPPQDSHALAAALQSLLVDPGLRQRLGEAGRKRALEHFSLAETIRRTQKVYEAVLKTQGAPQQRVHGGVKQRLMAGSRVKRALDIILSATGLVGSLPLWGIIALAVKMNDGGPVFYRQRRVGKDCQEFVNLKFRSMVADSDQAWGAVPARRNDPRITRVGRILRATAMDELPQLWNILRGDMSFVGPRAEWVELAREFRKEVPSFDRRHTVRPGLTGLAQVYGHSESPPRQKLKYDLLYIKKQNVWLDLRLVLISFFVTFLGRWEDRTQKLPHLFRDGRKKRLSYVGIGKHLREISIQRGG